MNVILRVWYSFTNPGGGCFTTALFSGSACVGPLSTRDQRLIMVLFLPALILAAWGLWFVAGRVLRPLSVTAHTVQQLGPQNLGQLLQLVWGTGHPDALAVQRLLTEVAMDDPRSSQDLHQLGAVLLRTNERNERLIEGLLVLAESDRGLQGKVPVRLDEVAESVLKTHGDLAAKHEVTLRRTLGERLVPGDPVLLERLISNLVTNAISYNKPGGWV